MRYRKFRKLLAVYASAAVAVLGVFSLVCYDRLQTYRRQTGADASRAFEETVVSVDRLSRSLEKSLYAADGGMSARVCAEICADARAAETALAALPFSTLEHEQVKRFLGVVGDYAFTLCGEAAEQGFTPEQRRTLAELSEQAARTAAWIEQTQSGVNDGLIVMDSREARLANVEEAERRLLSGAFDEFETAFPALRPLHYDGAYTARDEAQQDAADEGEARRAAAALLEVEPAELTPAAEYASGERYVYEHGSRSVCVGAAGVESLTDSRLVSESRLDEAAGEAAAQRVLDRLGYQDMSLSESRRSGALLELCYVCADGDVSCLDRTLRLTIALDDGSLYALDTGGLGEETESEWELDAAEAEALVPDGLTLRAGRRVTIASPGGNSVPCYELDCAATDGSRVRIYVRAADGKQQEILIG